MNWRQLKLVRFKILYHLKQQKGALFVLIALLLPVMFGSMGIAYDVGNLYIHKARLQNVADAAALAGGRAFLQSQKKQETETDKKDVVDILTGENNDAGGRRELIYRLSDSPKTKDRSNSKHSDADTAADAYIYKNLVNLGNDVKSDIYSHYALNSAGTNPKTFYRIGLSEEVSLFFLPVILKKSSQTVRAGAIALVEEGGTETSGGNIIIDPNAKFSIFDNLFTYSDSYFTRHTDHQTNGNIITAFKGNMVYTHGSSAYSKFYDYQDHRLTNHYYSGLGSQAENEINDAVINTNFDIDAYIEMFLKFLASHSHYDVKEQILYLNGNKNCDNNCEYTGYYVDGQEDIKLRLVGEDYYVLETDGTDKKLTIGDKTYDVCYHLMPPGGDNGPYVLCAKDQVITTTRDGVTYNWNTGTEIKTTQKYYLLNSNSQLTNCSIEKTSTLMQYNGWSVQLPDEGGAFIENNSQKYELKYNNGEFVYGPSNQPISGIIVPNISLAQPVNRNLIKKNDGKGNIFHVSREFLPGRVDNIEIYINDSLAGSENDPIYIIVEADMGDKVQFYGNASNERPINVVYLGTGKCYFTSYSGHHFKGTIFAPFASVVEINLDNAGQIFSGSVVAMNLNVQGTQDGATFEQKNYFENDNDIKADIEAIANQSEYNAQQAMSSLTEELQQYLVDNYNGLKYKQNADDGMPTGEEITLTVTKEDLANKNWYENLPYWAKQALYVKWKELYDSEKDANKKNLLWLWNGIFKKNDNNSNSSSNTTKDKLRLINFSTEFVEGTTVDPFINLTLNAPQSY